MRVLLALKVQNVLFINSMYDACKLNYFRSGTVSETFYEVGRGKLQIRIDDNPSTISRSVPDTYTCTYIQIK